MLQSDTCNFDFSSHNEQNIATYSESLKVSIEADFSGWGASFSASADYKKVENTTASTETQCIGSHATCEAYLAALEPGANLSDGFTIAVKHLSTSESDLDDYLNFIEQFGTHYLSSVNMGGRYGYQSNFETDKYMTMLSTGLDVSAAAGYSGTVDVNVKGSTQMEQEQAKEYNSYRESYSIYQVGGKPPTDPNGTSMAWAQTVTADPLPLNYHLVEIADLFTKDNFVDDPSIEKKQANLKNATVYYCKMHSDYPTATPVVQNHRLVSQS